MKPLSVIILFLLSLCSFSQNAKDDAPLTIVEQMPEYIGGESARNKFIQENIVYPRKKSERISGTCYITFVVEKDGSVTGVKLLRGISGGADYDEEAMRVIAMMPNWIPGKQNGKLVRVQYNIPIKFK